MGRPATRASTILVVDDEPDIGLILRIWLESAGCEVLEANTGETALSILARERPDLVILDLRMPDMEGWALLDEIRSDPLTEETPVVISSAASGRAAARRAAEQGCSYVTKPFDPAKLLRAIEMGLGHEVW